jgi:2-polyprenyl-3-methyl-5-hydroxy-6-metoxy-1,4-benzoquinol methylase
MTIRTSPQSQCHLCGTIGTYLYLNTPEQTPTPLGEWNLKKCNNPACGLCWLDPMPLKEEIGKLYDDYYTHYISNTKNLNWLKQTKYLLKLLFCLNPTVDRQKIMSDYMYLQEHKPGKLLDIGCGNGYFLKQMQQRGWDVVGTDFDEAAVNAVKQIGIDAYVGDLSTIKFEDNSFDAITLNNVIEHLYDPLGCLEKSRNLLRDGGQLTVITPNIESFGHSHFKQYWRGLETPRHLFLFSPKTLKAIAEKAGFKEIKSFTIISIKEIIKPGMYKASEKIEASYKSKSVLTSAQGSIKKRKFTNNLLALQKLFLSINNKDLGEFAVLLAKK